MSNLRILKKLSKRAAPLLASLGDNREQFRAEKDGAYIGVLIMERKHWDRGRSVHANPLGEREVKKPARDGKGWVYMRPPACARKGTIMVGCMSGYEEPEWSEESAWEALDGLVRDHFTDWSPVEADFENGVPKLTRDLRTPRQVLQAARDIIAAKPSPLPPCNGGAA